MGQERHTLTWTTLRGRSRELLIWCGLIAFALSGQILASAQSQAQTEVGGDDADQTFWTAKALKGKLIPITGDWASVDLSILFKLGSANLSETSMKQLDALAEALAAPEFNSASVAINGHTDAVGRAASNKILSEKRAASVVRYLTEAKGMPADKFTAAGFGEEQLLEGVDPRAAAQRRVQIVTTFPPKSEAEPPKEGGSEDDGTGPGVVIIN